MINESELLNQLRVAANPTELSGRASWPTLAAIAFDWSVIALAIAAMYLFRWWLHPFLLLLIASRQHALVVLMHDASHFLFCRNKAWNDLISDVFCALPFGFVTASYRASHIPHHEHLNTDKDPDLIRKVGPDGHADDWLFPLPLHRAIWLFSRDLMGRGFVEVFTALRLFSRNGRKSSTRAEYPLPLAVRLGFPALLLIALVLSRNALFFLYAWLVPLFLILPAILRLRSVAEHFALPKNHFLNESRTIQVPWWEAFFLAPHHVSLHLDHHLFPYVPWYRLPKLHARLLTNDKYRSHAHINSSYLLGPNSVLANIMHIHDDPRVGMRTVSS
ncbi:MAG: fatty acid desaturase family protein [Acidobacteriaceae bacterium]|nr:fatty acid desaturase family protein [Acidobacteriaceae bacterium]